MAQLRLDVLPILTSASCNDHDAVAARRRAFEKDVAAMLAIRKSGDRGHANFGWLDARHSFSFGQYYDSRHMGFGPLRVINEDHIAGGGGFPTHPHSDMEIVTYILEGALEHKDSLGTGSVIRPGDIQRMSAGTGIRHSEFNASKTEEVHLLQIWIEPGTRGLQPGYEQLTIPNEQLDGRLSLIGARDPHEGAVTIHQDIFLYAAKLATETHVGHRLTGNRLAWLQVARGAVTVNGQALAQGDGAAITEGAQLDIVGTANGSEILLFDMAA